MFTFPLFSQNMYVEINLNEARENPFSPAKRTLEILRVIDKAANDSGVRGLVLNIGSFPGSRTDLWEIRSAVEKFKSGGKKVCAVITSADIDTYCLASAADKIVMDELGTLNITGYTVGRGYIKNFLEKLGIGVRELRYFQYKSASEMYTRNSMSAADSSQLNDYLDDIFNNTRDALKAARSLSDSQFNAVINRDFLYSAKEAQAKGLVDYVGGTEAVKMAIREIEGESIWNFRLYGDPETSLMGDNSSYKPSNPGGLFIKSPIIAVIYAEGQTDMERGMNIFALSKIIREQADRISVKAIVIRIDSPGGSANAADYFAEAVRYAKSKKPVVVSMGDVAASGGYWAAMNANHIAASPYTITGSIGVIGSWFYDNGLNAKIGMSLDRLSRGEHADLYTGFLFPYRDLTAQEEARYKSYILDLYNIFIVKAAAGRSMEPEKIEIAAQGRVFSGKRALEAGLIDSIGGLDNAVRTARELAGIPESRKARYEEFPRPKFFAKLFRSLLMSSGIAHNKADSTFVFFADKLLNNTDIRYRLEKNGQVMPILPLDFSF